MPSQPLHILLVEDDEVDQDYLLRCLHDHAQDLAVTAVATATEALTLLRGQGTTSLPQPVLILLDLLLPGLSGLEFLQALRQDPHLKQTIVFVVTDSTSPSDRSAAYELGVAGYLVKAQLDQDCTALSKLLTAYRQLVEFPAIWVCVPLWLFFC
jgi:CheY-like chemotaxis protein